MRILSLVLAAVVFAALPAVSQETGARTIPSAAYQGASSGGLLVDIREPAEWAETGMPAGSVGVSISRTDFVDGVLKAAGGDKAKPIALICRSGTRSLRGARMLTDAGFTNVANVGDGMIGRKDVGSGWLASGLPLQAPPKE